MKPIFWIIVAILLSPFVVTAALFSQELVPAAPSADEWADFVRAINGVEGMQHLGVAGFFVQLVMFFWRDEIDKLSGKWKLVLVHSLSLIGGVIAMRLGNFDWASAVTHANTLGAFMVFGHQFVKQWFGKDDDRYLLPPPK